MGGFGKVIRGDGGYRFPGFITFAPELGGAADAGPVADAYNFPGGGQQLEVFVQPLGLLVFGHRPVDVRNGGAEFTENYFASGPGGNVFNIFDQLLRSADVMINGDYSTQGSRSIRVH